MSGPAIHAAASHFRYHPQVFIAPPWPEIFGQDAERRQSFDEARETYEAMVEAYTAQGYALTHLPRSSVEERANFVVDRMKQGMLSS